MPENTTSGASSDTGTYPDVVRGIKAGCIGGAVVAVLWAGFWCWVLCLPDVAIASLPRALCTLLGSLRGWRSTLLVFAVFFLLFGALAALRPSAPLRTTRKATWAELAIVIMLLTVSVLATGYLGWARYRVSNYAIMKDQAVWPRPWPYPDGWLLRLNNWIDARNPPPPGTFKLHSEIPLVQLIMEFAVASAALVDVACASVLLTSWWRRRRPPDT